MIQTLAVKYIHCDHTYIHEHKKLQYTKYR